MIANYDTLALRQENLEYRAKFSKAKEALTVSREELAALQDKYQQAVNAIYLAKNENARLQRLLNEATGILPTGETAEEQKIRTGRRAAKIALVTVSNYLEVSIEEMEGKNREREVVYARQLAQYLIYTYSGLSLKVTGEYFNRDHTTVMNSRKVIANYYDTDEGKRAEIDHVRELFLKKFKKETL